MLTPEEIAERLSDRNLRVVADRTGISYPVVWRASKFPKYGLPYDVGYTLSCYLEEL